MATIIDFKTRKAIKEEPTERETAAKFEIIRWNDPIVRDMVRVKGRVLIDGLVPIALALQFKKMCEQHNAVA